MATYTDYFYGWHSGACYLLDYPCFDVRSWVYHSWFHLVELHWFVVLPVVLIVGCFQHVETSTVWWLVLCNLSISPVCIYMRFFCECDCASVVTQHWDWHEGLLDVIKFICCLLSGSPSIFIWHWMYALILFPSDSRTLIVSISFL